MLPQIHFIFITHCLVRVVFCQRIHLFTYKQANNCSISLVEENDMILMYGKVDFNENILTSSVVNFEIKRKTEKSFQFLCFLKVPEDCDKDFYYCNCLETGDHKVFEMSLNITAFTLNSNADIRMELVYRETSFFSEIRNLPIVYGPKTDLVVVYANDQVVHFQQTDVSINDTQVTILSVCRETFAHECKQQLTDLETGTLVKSGKEIVVYNIKTKGGSNFELKYSVCNIERNISFSITTNLDKTTDSFHLTTETNPVVIILSTVSIMTLATIFCFVIFVRNQCFAREKTQIDRKKLKKTHIRKNPHHFTSDQSRVQSKDDDESPLIGDHETHESEGGEADLHKYLIGCKKNPGHSQSISVDTFTLKHLPEGLQGNGFYEYIKIISDQTVRVDVKMTSPHRPKFYPNTTQPYPFYNMSDLHP